MSAFRFRDQRAQRMDILPPETAARTRGYRQPAKPEIVDAEFETVGVSVRRPSRTTFNNNRTSASGKPAHCRSVFLDGFMSLAAVMERLLQRASPRAFLGLVAGTSASVFLFAVAFASFPSMDAPKGLHVAGVSTSLDDLNGMKVLSVYGRVVNSGPGMQTVPPILVDVVTGGAIRTTSSLRSQVMTIAAGQSSYFSARLPHKGGKMPEVRVSLGPVGAPSN